MSELDFRAYWEKAFPWTDYYEKEIHKLADLWRALYARAEVPAWAVERAREIGGEWRVLLINEDWCGDAVNTVPVIARLAEAVPGIELRIVKRDENPELMDEYLTGTARSIPLVVLLDEDFRPRGRWGPRPAELQEFVLREKSAGTRPPGEIYRDVRTWYARDRGETTLREVLEVVEAAAASA